MKKLEKPVNLKRTESCGRSVAGPGIGDGLLLSSLDKK